MDTKSLDTWIHQNTFDSLDYTDHCILVQQKFERCVTVSVIMPTLEEENTVGTILDILIKQLMWDVKLLDEIIVIDGGSKDKTIEICESFLPHIRLLHEKDILTSATTAKGKGNQLWKALFCTNCDIVIYIDSDLKNFTTNYVTGILGPLLFREDVKFIKGFYERKMNANNAKTNEGGRVTEICARPLINLFYPMLSGFVQPLSGEYGGYTDILKNVSFNSSYGVEMKLLIEICNSYGLECMGQVNLYEKEHDHQPLNALTKMSFTIMKTMLKSCVAEIPSDNRLLIKNCKVVKTEHTKIRSEEHVHCNNSGDDMDNNYFKCSRVEDVDLLPINVINDMYKKRINGTNGTDGKESTYDVSLHASI